MPRSAALSPLDAILSGLRPIPISGRPAASPMWVAPELLEHMRRGTPRLLTLELPRADRLQVDDQIDPPTPPRSRRRRS